MQPTAVAQQVPQPTCAVCKRVVRLQADGPNVRCLFADGTSQPLSRFVGGFIRPADRLEFDPAGTDVAKGLRASRLTSDVAASSISHPSGT